MNKIPLLAIDPGPTYSALVGWDGERVLFHEKMLSTAVCSKIEELEKTQCYWGLLIERVTLYQAADQNLHDTILWCGRYLQYWAGTSNANARGSYPCFLIPRATVKTHVTGFSSSKDGTVIAALKDRFGHPSRKRKLAEGEDGGVLWGVTADCWQALALAVYGVDKWEKLNKKEEGAA